MYHTISTARRLSIILCASLVCFVPLQAVNGRMDPTQDRLNDRERLSAELKRLNAADKLPDAIAAAEKLLALDRQIHGPDHRETLASLARLADLQERREDFAAARAKRQQVLDIQLTRYGKDDWATADARRRLADLDRLISLPPDNRRALLHARHILDQVGDLGNKEKYDEALPLAQQLVEVRKRILGERNLEYAESLVELGWICREKKDYARAEALYSDALRIEKETIGESNPHYGEVLNNLGWLHIARNELAKAEAVFREAADVCQRSCGEKDLNYVISIDNLQFVYYKMRAYAKSEPLLRRVIDLRREIQGPLHPDSIYALEKFAYLNQCMRQYAVAEDYYRQAVDVRKRAVGEDDPIYARSLQKLAQLFYERGDFTQAEPLFRQVLEIRKRTLGERHADNTAALHNLAAVYMESGAFSRAQPLYEEALAIKKETVGEKSASYAVTLDHLAGLSKHRKDYAKAETLYRQVLAIRQEIEGEKSEGYIYALNRLGNVYHATGDYARAVSTYRRVLELSKKIIDEKDTDYAIWLNNLTNSLSELAYQDADRGDFAAARHARLEIQQIYSRLYVPQDWRLTNARIEIELVDRMEKMSPSDRQQLAEATKLRDQETALFAAGRFTEALPLAERTLEIRRRILGEKHRDTIIALSGVGYILKEAGQYARAIELDRQALEFGRETLGEKHPETKTYLHNLAAVNEAMGNLREAECLYRQALALNKEVQGERNIGYATTLNSVAVICGELGNVAECERLYRESLRIRKELYGETDPHYADALLNLGFHYKDIGDYAKAEPLLRQAVAIYKNAFGEKHVAYARGIDFLASLYFHMKKYDKAEPLYLQALAIRKSVHGENHPAYATSLQNTALLYTNMKQYAKAEALYRQALAIDLKARGEKSAANTTVITNLALLLDEMGKYAEAEPLYQEALQLHEQATGRDSSTYRSALFNLAEHLASRGDTADAERMIRDVLRDSRRQFQKTLATMSEREQLSYRGEVRGPLNVYLSLTAADAAKTEDVYAEVLAWKAPVSALQASMRRARRADRAAGRSKADELYTNLEEASHKLSVLSRATPDPKHPDQLRQDLQDVSERVEALQRELADASAEFRQARDRQHRNAEGIRKSLPADAVLVDLFEYGQFQPAGKNGPTKWPLHLAAFIVRPSQPVLRIELGPVDPITQALDSWRRELARPGSAGNGGADVRGLLWQPLESHLGDARVVLISPSGALARLPFAALPGREPGRYLIEERALAIVPVPEMLPDLVAARPADQRLPSVLVVSAVDFDAVPITTGFRPKTVATPPVRAESAVKWPALPGTGAEADGLTKAFRAYHPDGTVVDLRASQASDEAIRREAPQRRYLHFATHGYFALRQMQSAAAAASKSGRADEGDLFLQKDVAGFHPGLMSGLVLAGANHPDAGQGGGILTALEVENLDLAGVELATLSACETGLGEYAGGEGLLGLQRAFQTAGARAVVAGLWKVDDAATQALMAQFYARLWDGKHGKLEALREAQLALLRTYDPTAGRLRGVGGVAVDARARSAGGKLPPFFWAAFAISGDWR